MKEKDKEQLIRGFIFACTDKTEGECFERLLFGAQKTYAPIVIRIRRGDLLFLNNLDTDTLYGVFKAVSDGDLNIQPDAWNGKYPHQVKVDLLGEKIALRKSRSVLAEFKIRRNTPIFGKKLVDFLDLFLSNTNLFNIRAQKLIHSTKGKIMEKIDETDIEEEIPLIEATTLWDFPKQSYGKTLKGDNKYPGVTPALLIWNLVWRYTESGDLVVDPMCGSGTTIDVCKEEGRRVIGYDISPTRPDIIQNDARKIPLPENHVDLVFVDSPYGESTNTRST